MLKAWSHDCRIPPPQKKYINHFEPNSHKKKTMQMSFGRTIELDKVFNSLYLEPIQQTEDDVILPTLPISG